MKIVEPSFEVIEDQLEKLTIMERIEHCGRICYKSESRITPDSAIPFCKKMVESGHGAVLEMATVHLVCPSHCVPLSNYVKFQMLVSDEYTSDTYTGPPMYVVTGSIRALMEADNSFEVSAFLASEFPIFFKAPEGASSDFNGMEGIRFAKPHEIPDSHRRVAVKFIVNRAVSHELVRHRPCSFLQESQRYCRYEDEVVFINPEWATKENRAQRSEWAWMMDDCEEAYKKLLKTGLSPQQARAVLPNSTKTEIIVYADLPGWKHIFSLRDHPAADPEMRRVMAPLHQEFKRRWPDFF